jgi:phage gp46-like protein
MKDFKITINGVAAELDLNATETTIVNNIWLSLVVPKGSWWHDPTFGSRLKEIKKLTASAVALAKDYCDEACKWILKLGRATSITFKTEADTDVRGRLLIHCAAVQADGLEVNFTIFKEVY